MFALGDLVEVGIVHPERFAVGHDGLHKGFLVVEAELFGALEGKLAAALLACCACFGGVGNGLGEAGCACFGGLQVGVEGLQCVCMGGAGGQECTGAKGGCQC